MAVTALTIITTLLLLTSTPADAMKNSLILLPPLPKTPSLRDPLKIAPIARDLAALKKSPHVRARPTYAFGATAAQTLEEAISLGFFKNEHPYKPNSSLINKFEIGHCVIVPRSDQRFSYGFVTEIVGPDMVCVACDKKFNNDYSIKIIATNKLFLHPEWLNHTKKDPLAIKGYEQNIKQPEILTKNTPKQ